MAISKAIVAIYLEAINEFNPQMLALYNCIMNHLIIFGVRMCLVISLDLYTQPLRFLIYVNSGFHVKD